MRLGVDLIINGEIRFVCVYLGVDFNFSVNGSNMVVVYLNKGDEVWVCVYKSWDLFLVLCCLVLLIVLLGFFFI